ncbi:T7SS effector LXG polymorphic toxin [Bacillus sp. P14.5]|uniref:T7SS effector LXG polymorphic toxin n=1 Tax=Bacillus sp. P14.5 TaxID=1983400 RepID=UPI000DE92C63|nr:T7SS effector LXG polymorphic toxin [Bacillus sp. P14.5]
MKVIDVSEVFSELNISLDKKEKEKEQVTDLRHSLNRIINLDAALKGKGGEAIRENITLLHIPAVLLLNQFLDDYTKTLNDLQNMISDFEKEQAIVRQDFIEQETQQGINRVENMTEDSINEINQEYMEVIDLVGGSPISPFTIQYSFDKAKRHLRKTVDGLEDMDSQSLKTLKETSGELERIVDFINKIEDWTAKGLTLSGSTMKEIEKYLAEKDTIGKLLDSAEQLALKEGDATLMGQVADWLDKLGKLNGGKDAIKGTVAMSILLSRRLVFEKDGKGQFRIKAHPYWLKNNGAYRSKLASAIHKILDKGSKSNIGTIKNYFKEYNGKPSRLLRKLVGLKSGTNLISFHTILERQHPYLDFRKGLAQAYSRFSLDMKSTVKQFTNTKSLKAVLKKVPYAGIIFSVATNGGELVSDKNKNKTLSEKIGRATAGIGTDIAIAGMTTGGAAIGTLICPGVGTVIGGAIGATIGIVGSIKYEEHIKNIGESAGKWVGDKVSDAGEKMGNLLSNTQDLVSGLFR